MPGCLGLLFNLDSLLLNLLLVSLLGLHHRQRVRHLQRLRHQWGILLPLRTLNRQPLPHTRLTLHNWVHHFLRRLPLGNIYNHNPKRFFTDTKCTSRSFRSTIKGGNFVTEINHQGFACTREPESYFYFLTGDDTYARHTSDYWRSFFNIPTRHFENPYHYGDRRLPTPSPPPPFPPPSIATLAAQLHERLFTPPTSGTGPAVITSELTSELSFEQLQALTSGLQVLASSSPAEMSERPAAS